MDGISYLIGAVLFAEIKSIGWLDPLKRHAVIGTQLKRPSSEAPCFETITIPHSGTQLAITLFNPRRSTYPQNSLSNNQKRQNTPLSHPLHDINPQPILLTLQPLDAGRTARRYNFVVQPSTIIRTRPGIYQALSTEFECRQFPVLVTPLVRPCRCRRIERLPRARNELKHAQQIFALRDGVGVVAAEVQVAGVAGVPGVDVKGYQGGGGVWGGGSRLREGLVGVPARAG